MGIGNILFTFKLYSLRLLDIQLKKIKLIENRGEGKSFIELREAALGTKKTSNKFGKIVQFSELELIWDIDRKIDQLLRIKNKLIGKVNYFAKELKLKDDDINYFLRIMDILIPLRKLIRGGILRPSLMNILEEEAKALKQNNYKNFLKLYELEKSCSYKVFKAYQNNMNQDLKLAHSINDPLLNSSLKIFTRGTLFFNFLITVISLLSSITLKTHLDVWQGEKLNLMYRKTAISGLAKEVPPDNIPISKQEKAILKNISNKILSNPRMFFIPSQRNVRTSISGNMLYFKSRYVDKFYRTDKVMSLDSTAYASYLHCDNSDEVVIILPGRYMPEGLYKNLAREFRKAGMSSLIMVLPGHGPRRNPRLKGKDKVITSSIYGSIENVIQMVNDTIIAIDWLEKNGYKKFAVHSTSVSSIFHSILLAIDNRISTNVFNIPGDDIAEAFMVGSSSKNLRNMYTNAGVTLSELSEFWECISPIKYIEKIPQNRGRKLSALVGIARLDLTAGEVKGKNAVNIANLLKRAIAHVEVDKHSQTHFTFAISRLVHTNKTVDFIKKHI